jgi:hypothetical protein
VEASRANVLTQAALWLVLVTIPPPKAIAARPMSPEIRKNCFFIGVFIRLIDKYKHFHELCKKLTFCRLSCPVGKTSGKYILYWNIFAYIESNWVVDDLP